MMYKKVSSSLLVFLVSGQLFGQTGTLDSLKSVLEHTRNQRVETLIEIADNYVDSVCLNDFVVGCLEEALDSAILWKDDSIQIDVCNYLGLADYNVEDYENSVKHFYKALNLLEKSPNIKQQSKVYNNLGMIFDKLEDYHRALEFYRESYQIDSAINNWEGLIISYINLGTSYQNLKQYDSSRIYNDKAYQFAKINHDSLSMIDVLNNQGTLEYDLKNYDKSLDYYQEALKLYRNRNDLEGVAITKNNIGLVYLNQKKYDASLTNFNEALKLATALNLDDFSGDIFGNLSVYYKETKDYRNAYDCYNKYNEIGGRLVEEKRNKMIRKLEAQYQFEKKQREIQDLKQENMQQKELLSSSRSMQEYLYVIIFMVIVFLAGLFYLLRKEKLLANELHEKTKELEKLNKSKDRFFSIIAHDLKNPFNALVSYTSLLRTDFDTFTKEELIQIVTDLNDATEKGFDLLENLLYWTRSQTNRIKVYKTFFDLQQIVDNVIGLAKPNLSAKSQTMEVEIDEGLKVYADKDMIATVIRNLIFNSIKFSHPNSAIRIEGKKKGPNIQISVIDHGVGVDADKQHKFFNYEENTTTPGTDGEMGSGLGLLICREFIEKNDGLIWVESEPGKGATFRFTIPYVEPAS